MDAQRQALIEAALEQAADRLGDVTAPVMAAFYAQFPEARASFEHHWPGKAERLEAEMVGNALYFIMTWFARRSEVEIALGTSIPHHHHTLQVPAEWYGGMITATLDVLAENPPDAATAEAWAALRGQLETAVAGSL